MAGPKVDLRLATIAGADAVKQANRTNRKFWSDAGAAAEIQGHHAPVNIIGGYRFSNAPTIDLGVVSIPADQAPPTPH